MVTAEISSASHTTQWGLPVLLKMVIVGVLLAGAAPAFADAASDHIKDLENKLQALQNDFSQMTRGMAGHSNSGDGLPIHGFMDVGFTNNSQANAVAYPKGFNVGALSFYLAPHFGDQVKALVEPNFEVTPEGAIATDLERLQIGYTFSDTATLWAGRFHTPYGYWNTGFHHGAQMQTSVLWPRFLDFEDKGGILPAHMVGLWGTGKIRAGEGKFTYDVFAGNGPRIAMADPTVAPSPANLGILDINLAGDNNHQAMLGLNLGYEFSGNLDGMRVAIHALRGDVDDNTPLRNKTDLNMYGGSFVYLENDWELLSELYKFRNLDRSGATGTHSSSASYFQIGRTFNNLTPYMRKEEAMLSQLDNYFGMQANGQSYTRYVGGIKYALSQKACLKLEVHYSNFEAESGRTAAKYHSLYTQYAIRF